MGKETLSTVTTHDVDGVTTTTTVDVDGTTTVTTVDGGGKVVTIIDKDGVLIGSSKQLLTKLHL